MTNYILKNRNNSGSPKANSDIDPIAIFLSFLLSLSVTIFFAIEYSDLKGYFEDHNSNINRITILVFASFLFIFYIVNRAASYLKDRLEIEEKKNFRSKRDAFLWLIWEAFIGVISITLYSIIFISIFSDYFNLPNSAERTVFEHDFINWVVSMYLAKLFILKTDVIAKLLDRFLRGRSYAKEVKP